MISVHLQSQRYHIT
uniref:Uncharacterized protein n=1 Tax=Anguilla anguilla TaxID=7936 RepID=A0A0E9SB50_ANGAN